MASEGSTQAKSSNLVRKRRAGSGNSVARFREWQAGEAKATGKKPKAGREQQQRIYAPTSSTRVCTALRPTSTEDSSPTKVLFSAPPHYLSKEEMEKQAYWQWQPFRALTSAKLP